MMATSSLTTRTSRSLIRQRPTPSFHLSPPPWIWSALTTSPSSSSSFSTAAFSSSCPPPSSSSSSSSPSSWTSSSNLRQRWQGRYQVQQQGPRHNHLFLTTTTTTTMRRRTITTKSAARRLLGLKSESFTVQELRHAYFKMAKTTHPDMKKQFDDVETVDDPDAGGKAFLDVTRAYELLLNNCHDDGSTYRIPVEEEEEYRRACQLILGIDATIVEESKTNPMFLHWLMGNTDGAQHWRSFFAVHGGLAQKLRPPAGYLHDGDQGDGSSGPSRSRPRRQRPPRW